MKNYIEQMEDKFKHSSNWTEQFEIVQLLRTEQERCLKILNEYKNREIKYGVYYPEVCKHEQEIIDKINNILNNKC